MVRLVSVYSVLYVGKKFFFFHSHFLSPLRSGKETPPIILMTMTPTITICVLATLSLILPSSPSAVHIMSSFGRPHDLASPLHDDPYLRDLASFAVDQHNSGQNSDLTFLDLVSARKHVVAGTMYHLKLKASSGGQTRLYEAKIWVKPWENFKSLEDFKLIESTFTSADLGSLSGQSQPLGLQQVSCDDPSVKEAAKEAIKVIQQRSNSLIPYELKEVLSAWAEVNLENTNFSLLFKVRRGEKEENFKADIWRTVNGMWTVKELGLHHSDSSSF